MVVVVVVETSNPNTLPTFSENGSFASVLTHRFGLTESVLLLRERAREKDWISKAESPPAGICEGHCHVLYALPLSIALCASPLTAQSTNYNVNHVLMSMCQCTTGIVDIRGGWWAKGSGTKMRGRLGNGWLCLIISTRKCESHGGECAGLSGCCDSMQRHARLGCF